MAHQESILFCSVLGLVDNRALASVSFCCYWLLECDVIPRWITDDDERIIYC